MPIKELHSKPRPANPDLRVPPRDLLGWTFLIDYAPEQMEDLAEWFGLLTRHQVDAVWVQAVLNAAVGEFSIGDLGRALAAVRDWTPTAPGPDTPPPPPPPPDLRASGTPAYIDACSRGWVTTPVLLERLREILAASDGDIVIASVFAIASHRQRVANLVTAGHAPGYRVERRRLEGYSNAVCVIVRTADGEST